MFKNTLLAALAFISFSAVTQAADPILANRFIWLHAANGVDHEVVFGSTRDTVIAWHDNRNPALSYNGVLYLPKFQDNSIATRPSLQFGYDVTSTTGNPIPAPTYLQATRSISLQSLSIFAVVRSQDTLYGPIFSGVNGVVAPWSFEVKGSDGLVWRQGNTISAEVKTGGRQWNIVELERQGTGVKIGSNGLLAPRVVFAETPPAGVVSRIGGTTTDDFTGNIAELLVYTKPIGTALMPEDRASVLKYLSGRYKIALVNPAPKVRVTSPISGSIVAKGKTPMLKVTAFDDGTVVSVKYFVDGLAAPLAEVKTAPFTYTWRTAKVGTHTVKAVATDEFGKTKTSAMISFTRK